MSGTKKVLATMALVTAAVFTGCATDPTTGDRFFSIYTWDQETALGLEAASSFTDEFGGDLPNESVRAYVTEVGSSMIPHVEEGVPDDLPWEFTILNSDVVNAFALPGGQVFITRGLASQLDNEAQLAGVLGHEIGHVTARHGNQQMSKSVALQGGLAASALVIGAADEDSVLRQYGTYGLPVAQVGGQLVLLSYGRDAEYQSDELGMRYMSLAGYKPSGQRGVMQKLAQLSSGGQRPPAWLATHPYPEARIDRINELLRTTFAQAEASGANEKFPDRYRQRMLQPLASMPAAPPPPTGDGTAMLPDAAIWCALCGDDADDQTLAARWSRRVNAHE
ncbi:MAG: M48 family metallopeptidase [Phycisphaera sp.]|nr:MAG: M48 family metallopeptidase [Phycisphaera sp.]